MKNLKINEGKLFIDSFNRSNLFYEIKPKLDVIKQIIQYINEKGDQSIAAITSPSGHETCMMYRSFDLRAPGLGT